MRTGTEITIIVCLLASIALVAAELRNWAIRRAVFKIIASSTFVLLVLQLGATSSAYGRLILAALVFSWLGDVFLLSKQNRFFLTGIASFLLAHIVFSIAFASLPLNGTALIAGLAGMSCVGILVLKWLWHHLPDFYRLAVSAYVAAIIAMCGFAVAVSAASGNWLLATGALTFAASDISVARDRFVSPGFINRAWGLPLYYAAQILLALSVANVWIGAV